MLRAAHLMAVTLCVAYICVYIFHLCPSNKCYIYSVLIDVFLTGLYLAITVK